MAAETRMPLAEWRKLPKDGFHEAIKLWCAKHGHLQNVETEAGFVQVPGKLPYKLDPADRNFLLVDTAFLDMRKPKDGPPVRIEPLGRHALALKAKARPGCAECSGVGERRVAGTWIACTCIYR